MAQLAGQKSKIAILVIVVLVCIVLFWPSLRWMVNSWLSSDYYSHGFLVPFISGFFVWLYRRHLKNRQPSLFGIGFLLLAVFLYLLALSSAVRVLGILSLLSLITGLVFLIWGNRAVKALLFPLVFLLFMVPFWFIQDLAFYLQNLSVHWAAGIVKFAGLPIITYGNQIEMNGDIFTIGIVCSGINTLVALLALSAVYARLLKGRLIKRSSLFVLAFFVAIAANILRICSILLVAYFFDAKTATGWYHDISSAVFFAIAFAVLILIARLMKLKLNYEVFSTFR